MPNTVKKDQTKPLDWVGDPTKCATCPAHLVVSHDLNLLDHDINGETGATPVNAHLETVTLPDGQKQRRLVLS